MKKYILLLVTALSFAQASNQMVTFTQAQSLGYTLNSGQSHTTSNQCMTKLEALAKYNLDSNAMSSYTSNQLVPKSVWVNGVVGVPFTTSLVGYGMSPTACSSVSTSGNTFYTVSGVKIGSQVYSDQSCTIVSSMPGLQYFLILENGIRIVIVLDSGLFISQRNICP